MKPIELRNAFEKVEPKTLEKLADDVLSNAAEIAVVWEYAGALRGLVIAADIVKAAVDAGEDIRDAHIAILSRVSTLTAEELAKDRPK